MGRRRRPPACYVRAMTAVLVHGNPETPVIWEPMVAQLERSDVVCLQLPGFGCPAPPGFGATKEEYADWLVTELELIAESGGPVDLVGHDWGGGLAMRAVSLRPELVRTWASDGLGLFHPDYVWHDLAQIWQTEGAGEEYFDAVLATSPGQQADLLESVGIPRSTAVKLVASSDAEMGRCVLSLYRSATQPAMLEWGRALSPAARLPGLNITAPLDPFVGSGDLGGIVAAQLGARTHEMEGQGHWWMLGDPGGGARALESFWASV